jgi:hypothetical protein
MFSYHRYNWSDATLQEIVNRANTYGLQTGMLEWWFENATYEVLYKDLNLGQNSAWQGEVLRGLFEIDDSDPDNLIVTYRRNAMYNRQYFKWVRSGAVRIDATSDGGQFNPLAFVNSDGTWIVVVKASSGGALIVDGLPMGTYGVTYTTGGAQQLPIEYDVTLSDIAIAAGEPLATAIPDLGLITVYGKSPTVSVPDGGAGDGTAGSPPTLLATYPNPTATGTTIRYVVPHAAAVELSVVDVAGRLIDVVTAGPRDAGVHSVTWSRSDVTDGIYFAQLKLDGKVAATRKLILSR